MKAIRTLFISIILFSTVFSQNKVYVASIDGMIDLGLAPYVKRVISEAEKKDAKAILFKINTFGGRVDAATQIKDAILNTKILTVAFIDKRAISAGSLISLSCNKVIMVPGATIGATTVVDMQGNKQSEKAQAYMRSEMRATAEKNGRPPEIAEAMVDERVIIEGLVDSTQLVSLTSEEALKWGIADTIKSSVEEALQYLNINEYEIIEDESNWAEDTLRFIQNPIITSLLLMIGMVGMFVEIKTPGWGLPGTAAIIALTIFFGSHYILDLASMLEIILFIIGVVLLILEIFFIPGFGLPGILGILFIVGSLFLGLIPDFKFLNLGMLQTALIQLASAFLLSIALIAILLKFLPKTKLWHNLILEQNIKENSGYSSVLPKDDLLYKEGIAFTDLRPSGIAIIDDDKIDVITEGEYIERNTKIKVIKIDASKVVVKES